MQRRIWYIRWKSATTSILLVFLIVAVSHSLGCIIDSPVKGMGDAGFVSSGGDVAVDGDTDAGRDIGPEETSDADIGSEPEGDTGSDSGEGDGGLGDAEIHWPDTSTEDTGFEDGGITDAGLEDAGPGEPDVTIPDDPRIVDQWENPHRCGATPYRWALPHQVGQTVSWQESAMHRLSPEILMSLIEASGHHAPRDPIHPVRGLLLRYGTQNKGQLVEATSMVAIPDYPADASQAFPVLLLLHGTTGFSDLCAPSADQSFALIVASLFASLGYIVVAPDFYGMNGFGDPSSELHPYLVGEPVALSSLDAVRATRAMLPQIVDNGVVFNDQVMVSGASQGGHAALFTIHLAPYYAPEMTITAASVSVAPSNLLLQVSRTLDSFRRTPASYLAAMMVAFDDWYGLGSIDLLLKAPFDTLVRQRMEETCRVGDLLQGVNSLSEVFTEALLEATASGDWSSLPQWECALLENTLETNSLQRLEEVPTLWVLAESDDLVLSDNERSAFENLCADGHTLEYLECAGARHSDGAIWSLEEQLDFFDARATGQPWEQANICTLSDPVTCLGTR